MRTLHVIPQSGGWAVRAHGAERARRVFTNQAEAVSFARTVAKRDGGVMFIHRADGMVKSRSSFGDVERSPRK